jgi:DNA polymerase-1
MANLTIIDGHNYLFKSFYGVPDVAQTKSGTQVNAVYGFFASLRQIAAAYPKNKIFVVFDSETGINTKLDERGEYKAGRNIDANMFKQLPYIKQILDVMGIKWLEHPKFEADDIIASLAANWAGRNGSVYILSNDFDFVQMISDKIHLIRNYRGRLINCDDVFIKEKFGICPYQYVDYLSIVGDRTDNIIGAKGLGRKITSNLLDKYDNIFGIFDNLSELMPGVQTRLNDNRNLIYKNRNFMSMNKNIKITEILSCDLPETQNDIIQQKIAIHMRAIGLV